MLNDDDQVSQGGGNQIPQLTSAIRLVRKTPDRPKYGRSRKEPPGTFFSCIPQIKTTTTTRYAEIVTVRPSGSRVLLNADIPAKIGNSWPVSPNVEEVFRHNVPLESAYVTTSSSRSSYVVISWAVRGIGGLPSARLSLIYRFARNEYKQRARGAMSRFRSANIARAYDWREVFVRASVNATRSAGRKSHHSSR